jgi:26S proteasome regulatory subunit T5
MSSAPPPSDPPGNPEKKPEDSAPSTPAAAEGIAMDTTPDAPVEESWEDIPEDIMVLSTEEINTRTRLIENDIKVRKFLWIMM